MSLSISEQDVLNWLDIIWRSTRKVEKDMRNDFEQYKARLIVNIALAHHAELLRIQEDYELQNKLPVDFGELTIEQKLFSYDFARDIPRKLKEIKLKIEPFEKYCRTTIIPDEDVNRLSQLEHERWCEQKQEEGWRYGSQLNVEKKTHPDLVPYLDLELKKQRCYHEVIYAIPKMLKDVGFEIIRPEETAEIDISIVERMARVIHSKYKKLLDSGSQSKQKEEYSNFVNVPSEQSKFYRSDFDDLPDEIKNSNFANAFHIPAKLFAIGYKIRPVKNQSSANILKLTDEELETLSRIEHDRWSWDKRLNGWTFGKVRNNDRKKHPSLIPYDELSEEEKDKDRKLVKLIPGLLQDIGYEAYHISPERIRNISYAIKPTSFIYKTLQQTNKINREIQGLASVSPEVKKEIERVNANLAKGTKAVYDSYRRAKQIQDTFMPGTLFFRECFPDSFILYKPKDVVSGDFYFISRKNDLIVFAAADCTGHGIPGALISVLGYNFLDQAVNEAGLTNPSEILKFVSVRIDRFLKHRVQGTVVKDGMDIALCTFNPETYELLFSGINNPLYYISNNEIHRIRGNRGTLGVQKDGTVFDYKYHSVQLRPKDKIYVFSDGYADQLGGKTRRTFKSKRFRELLLDTSHLPMMEQCDVLNETIERWRMEGNEDQTDDIIVVGIKV